MKVINAEEARSLFPKYKFNFEKELKKINKQIKSYARKGDKSVLFYYSRKKYYLDDVSSLSERLKNLGYYTRVKDHCILTSYILEVSW